MYLTIINDNNLGTEMQKLVWNPYEELTKGILSDQIPKQTNLKVTLQSRYKGIFFLKRFQVLFHIELGKIEMLITILNFVQTSEFCVTRITTDPFYSPLNEYTLCQCHQYYVENPLAFEMQQLLTLHKFYKQQSKDIWKGVEPCCSHGCQHF